jgi:hypothetical protein
MINAIIFSKDRACQLRLLFESILYNSYKLLDGITVIYTTSDSEYDKGYSLLKRETFFPKFKIEWVQQSNNFSEDVLQAMRKYCQGLKSFITFFTDDSVFYKNIQEDKFTIESLMHPGSDVSCFSLRSGLNTNEQTYWQRGNIIQLQHTKVGKIIKWRHVDYPTSHGYGYPMSVDGHIFRADQLTHFVSSLQFTGPNSLEGCLCNYKYEIAPCMASFEQSALVIVPINRVQNESENFAGLFYGIPTKELNRQYLAGNIIDYHYIDFSNIVGTHQELEYTFKRKT